MELNVRHLASGFVEISVNEISSNHFGQEEIEQLALDLISAACDVLGMSHDRYDELADLINGWDQSSQDSNDE